MLHNRCNVVFKLNFWDTFSPTTAFKAEPNMNGIVFTGMNDDDRNEWQGCIFLLLSQHGGN